MGFISEEYHTKIVKDLTVHVAHWKKECRKALDEVKLLSQSNSLWRKSHQDLLKGVMDLLTNTSNSSLNEPCCDKVTSNENREGVQKLGCCAPNAGLSQKDAKCVKSENESLWRSQGYPEKMIQQALNCPNVKLSHGPDMFCCQCAMTKEEQYGVDTEENEGTDEGTDEEESDESEEGYVSFKDFNEINALFVNTFECPERLSNVNRLIESLNDIKVLEEGKLAEASKFKCPESQMVCHYGKCEKTEDE